MVRAAAKNHESVTVVVDPPTTPRCWTSSTPTPAPPASTRARARRQGVRAHGEIRHHGVELPAARANEGAGRDVSRNAAAACTKRSRTCATARTRTSRPRSIATRRAGRLRRHGASMLQGKELSFNNIADADTAVECVREFDEPACVIVKHANPCGVAHRGVAARRLRPRVSHRSHLRVRRHHRVQSRARRGHGARDHRPAVRRSDRGAVGVAADALAVLRGQGNVRVLVARRARDSDARPSSNTAASSAACSCRRAIPRWRRPTLQGGHQAQAHADAVRGPVVRLARVQVREIERHRVRAARA